MPDSIRVAEVGVRRLRRGPTGLALSGAVAIAHWRNIQADLVSRHGFPYTANIGNADITTAEGSLDWIFRNGFRVQGAFLFADDRAHGAVADQSNPLNRRLPDTPSFAADGSLSYRRDFSGVIAEIGATGHYAGRSVLGTGDVLDISQGDYLLLGNSAALTLAKFRLSATVDNLLNTRGDLFALGNPFNFTQRDQRTPLRPRSIRLGIEVHW